jgi:hypothetical protein
MELYEYTQSIGAKHDVFQSWIQEELVYLKDVTAEEPESPWKIDYVRSLQTVEVLRAKFEALANDSFRSYSAKDFIKDGKLPSATKEQRSQVASRSKIKAALVQAIIRMEDIEEEHGITQRWDPSDREYVEAQRFIQKRGFAAALDDLEGKVVQRLFELSKANLASTGSSLLCRGSNCNTTILGYKLRQQISKSITRRSMAVHNALSRYNELAPLQDPPRPAIDYKELLSYATLGEFDLLRYSRHSIMDKPWAKPSNREAAIKYFKVLGARKEIERLNIEARRLQDWVDLEDDLVTATVLSVSSTDPYLGAELEAFHQKRL